MLSSRLGNIELGVKHLFSGRGFPQSIVGVADSATLCSEEEGFGIDFVFYTKQIFAQSVLVQHELGRMCDDRRREPLST